MLEHKIEKFVTSGLNISKEKIYSSIDSGGLNLFKLCDFAMTLQAYWIKRAIDLKHDNWRTRVCNLNSSGPLAVTYNDAIECGEILRGIIKIFIVFLD
jgi:hypothetical protein